MNSKYKRRVLSTFLSSTFNLRAFAAVFAVIALFSLTAKAQAVSGVTGLIVDSNGGVVAGVKVTLSDTKTGRELTTASNETGTYSFRNVEPGERYKLSFSGSGFQTLVLSDVTLGVAKTETYNATLSAGDVSAVVDVQTTGSGDTLNTTDPSIGNVIDRRQLRELPIQFRGSPAALIGLQPGVVGNNVGTSNTNRVGSVTGARADQGNITVDGIDANDQATGQFAATTGNAPIDAIQEFRTVTVNPSASEGRSSGGQVQMVTKSGTNDYHGSLREYNRNEKFAANSFFNNRSGVARPKLNRNQFGGNIGGPVPFPLFGDNGGPAFSSGKDRLFFFFDFEGRRDASGITDTRIVPLQHFRNGGLAYISGTAANCATARLNDPATAGCITILTPAQIAQLDPQGVGANTALLNFINGRYPLPNDLSLGDGLNTGGIRFNSPVSRVENNYTTRFDANISDLQKVFVRFNIQRRTQTDTGNSVAAQFPGDPEGALIVNSDYAIAAGHSWAISSSLFNSFTIGNSHSDLNFPNGFRPAFPFDITFTTIDNPFAGIDTQSRVVDTPTIRDDVTWSRGNHTLTFGGVFKPIKSVAGLVNDFDNPTYGLGGNVAELSAALRPLNITSGIEQYDGSFAFLLGRLAQLDSTYTYDTNSVVNPLGTGKVRDFRYNEYEAYAQDTWKVRNDLTLTFGVRYQYYSPPYEANGAQSGNTVDFEELFSRRLANAAAGIAGDNAEPFLTYSLIGKANDSRPYYKPDRNNFAPRIGFAWAPSFKDGFLGTVFGDRKTSIRGGGSLVYERVTSTLTFVQDQLSYLFDNSATTAFGDDVDPVISLLQDPRFIGINSLPASNTAPIITVPMTPFVLNGVPFGNADGAFNYAIAQNFEVPYSYQYSFGIQRELPGDFLLEVSYAGRLGKKLFTQADAAQVLNFRDPASGQFLFDALNAIQSSLLAGTAPGSVPLQPFFENQGALAGFPCGNFGGCTRVVSNFTGALARRGDAADIIQFLNANGVLRNNVGMSGQFSTNAYITNFGKSRYDGLLVSLQKRFSHGLQFDINYTYSHSSDNNSSVSNTVAGGLIFDVRNTNLGSAPSDFDIRHLVNANAIWELPFGRGKWIGSGVSSWVDQIIGGWQLSGIFTYRSGLRFDVDTNSFPVSYVQESPAVLIGGASAVRGNINSSGTSINFFGDAAAAAAARAAFRNVRMGETGSRNALLGPSFWNADIGLAKNFTLPWEGHRLQLRMDAFNAFNHNVFANPGVSLFTGASTFGNITSSASAPRELQFAVRWDF